jgi:formylglycine-generating enzyme required for sulfatase activity
MHDRAEVPNRGYPWRLALAVLVMALLACRNAGSLRVPAMEIRFYNHTRLPVKDVLPVFVYCARDGAFIVESAPQYTRHRVEGTVVARDPDGAYRVRYPARVLAGPRLGLVNAKDGWWADVDLPDTAAATAIAAELRFPDDGQRRFPFRGIEAKEAAKRFATVSIYQFETVPFELVGTNGASLREVLPRPLVAQALLRVSVQTPFDEKGDNDAFPCGSAGTHRDTPLPSWLDPPRPTDGLPSLPNRLHIALGPPPPTIEQHLCVELLINEPGRFLEERRRMVLDRVVVEPTASFHGYAAEVTRAVVTPEWTVPCPVRTTFEKRGSGNGECVADRKIPIPIAGRGPLMVPVPGGSFLMGQTTVGPDASAPRRVQIQLFLIDLTEVTRGQYLECMRTGVCTGPGYVPSGKDHWQKLQRPMTDVGLVQAEVFCEWAGKRLPTEEEWEYAARGTDGRTYPWGEAKPSAATVCLPADRDALCDVGTHPAGISPFGLYDMAGNAAEWTATRWCRSNDSGTPCLPEERIIRGGGRFDLSGYPGSRPERLRAAYRDHEAVRNDTKRGYPSHPSWGFRCAGSVQP